MRPYVIHHSISAIIAIVESCFNERLYKILEMKRSDEVTIAENAQEKINHIAPPGALITLNHFVDTELIVR